jgi:hypothetical protein
MKHYIIFTNEQTLFGFSDFKITTEKIKYWRVKCQQKGEKLFLNELKK